MVLGRTFFFGLGTTPPKDGFLDRNFRRRRGRRWGLLKEVGEDGAWGRSLVLRRGDVHAKALRKAGEGGANRAHHAWAQVLHLRLDGSLLGGNSCHFEDVPGFFEICLDVEDAQVLLDDVYGTGSQREQALARFLREGREFVLARGGHVLSSWGLDYGIGGAGVKTCERGRSAGTWKLDEALGRGRPGSQE